MWLMAWVAWYMTERFASRTFSHSPADPAPSSTREPSAAGMLRMIAERSSGLALPSRSTRAVRSGAGLPGRPR